MKYIWSIFICFLLFSCENNINNDILINSDRPETDTQIYNKSDGSFYTGNGVVNATIVQLDGTTWIIQAGTISNGKLNFNFPNTIPEDKLESFWDNTLDHPNAFIQPENTKFCGTLSTFRYPFIVYNSIGENIGKLTFDEMYINDTGFDAFGVYYYYFDRDVTVSGFLNIPFTSQLYTSYIEHYQITAIKGWNKIYVYETSSNKKIVTTFSTDKNIIPKYIKWEFSE